MEENVSFEEYIEAYKELSIKDKRNQIVEDLKLQIALCEKLCSDFGIKHEMLLNREIVDLNQENVSEDDYLEGIYVYVCILRDSLGTFIDKLSDEFYQ